ncbi:MAG TPA: glucans biosynthesis glucosyltransferase MdoH [Candidatus Limnocylindria bacterium]|nr:glucans biosynthesis glucosyltransferase MdoH [Candidatus Limnocylindria bacterium]
MSALPVERPADDGGIVAVPRARLLHDWQEAHARVRVYLATLGIPEEEQQRLVGRALERALTRPDWAADATALGETMRAVRELLAGDPAPGDDAVTGAAFLRWRLARALGRDDVDPATFESTPPLTRASMVAHRIEQRGLRRRIVRSEPGRGSVGRELATPPPAEGAAAWRQSARRRRLLLAALVLLPTVVATGFMLEVLPQQGRTWLEAAIALVFGALFGWISIGFWTATIGFLILVSRDRFAITRTVASDAPISPEARTAIVMPICEEPVRRVFAGLQAMYRALERAGALEHFDFFVLSDTRTAGTALDEESAWLRWCRTSNGFGRVFYRRRRARVARKSGNVADFCRRWGRQYRYMIMLDADSVMTASALTQLVRLMEANPRVGMIQTAPTAVNQRTLFARVQQFGSRVYGPMFAAGLHFWQLGEGQYWGHNAIVRVQPFMDHCGLPTLPGRGPLGGEILSHDFVEAALMGRAGWELWLAFDLAGSHEEMPSSLMEEMQRDQRWCQGNLQHLGLLFAEGLFGAHRALFLNGVLSYVSAFLWLVFLVLSTAEAIVEALRPPDYFPHGRSLFPEWPVWHPDWAITLLAVTAVILFLPKILGFALVTLKWRNPRAFGGTSRLALSILLETLIGSLFAPIRMVFHSRFVVLNAIGRRIVWRSQTRGDAETDWRAALRYHGLDTVIATVWGLAVYRLNPTYFWWLAPILVALVLSVPLSILVSRVRWGERARRWGLFLIPEETEPPPELRELNALLAERSPETSGDGFARAVVEPELNAVHRVLLRAPRRLAPAIQAERRQRLVQALAHDPARLDDDMRRLLMHDPVLVDGLHEGVWALPDLSFERWLMRAAPPTTEAPAPR